MSTLIVGIDVSKNTLEVAHITNQEMETKDLGKFENNKNKIKALFNKLKTQQKKEKKEQIQLIVEPSGSYEQNLVYMAIIEGFVVSMPNPLDVRRWLEGIGTRNKTDKLDARGLAKYGASVKLPTWKPMPEEIENLAGLLERKEEIHANLRQEKNRLHALEYKYLVNPKVKKSIHRCISNLEKELEELLDDINQLLKEHPSIKEEADLLKGNPGVGDGTVLHYVVLCHRWQSLTSGTGNSKSLTAYAGIEPVFYVSGSSVYKRPRISKKGDPLIRAKLYMSALGGKKSGPLKQYYNALVSRGKHKKLALVACARKILTWIWAVFSTNTPFDYSRFSKS